MHVIYQCSNLMSICERFKTFARTVNRDKAEPRTYINDCVGLGKSPMETKQLLEKTNRILDGWGRKTGLSNPAGDRSGPELACLLTLNQAKQCVCRLSYTPVH